MAKNNAEATLAVESENTDGKGFTRSVSFKERVKSFADRPHAGLGEAALYAAVFLTTLILFLTLKPYYQVSDLSNGAISHGIVTVVLGGCVFAGVYMKVKGRLTVKRLIMLFLIAGFFLRVGYMLCTPTTYRQHDLYAGKDYGHEGYAWGIFSTGKLPSSNYNQLYHPPLNAFLQATFMRFMSGLESGLSELFGLGDYFTKSFLFGIPAGMDETRYALYSTAQILSVLYSFVVAVVSLKILRLFVGDGEKIYAFLAAFVIFYPRNIHFAASLNNDGVTYMLSVCALYFALKWWKKGGKLRDILLCALCVGLGMMGKLSSATVCLPIAGIFLWELVRLVLPLVRARKNQRKNAVCAENTGAQNAALPAVGTGSEAKFRESVKPLLFLLGQFALFLLVCAPIGLWFQVYAKNRFDQSFGYVFDQLTDKLLTSEHSLFERFSPIVFDLREYFGSLWCHTIDREGFPNNYNLFNFALRSSVFGENSYSSGEGFAVAALIFAYAGIVLLVVSAVRAICLYFRFDRRRKDEPMKQKRKDVFFIVLLVASQVFSEMYFYLKMPYACTMDFRYIMPLILGLSLTLWVVLGRLRRDACERMNGTSLTLYRLTSLVCVFFLSCGALFYAACA